MRVTGDALLALGAILNLETAPTRAVSPPRDRCPILARYSPLNVLSARTVILTTANIVHAAEVRGFERSSREPLYIFLWTFTRARPPKPAHTLPYGSVYVTPSTNRKLFFWNPGAGLFKS